ncbi:MAG: DNA mismatch repair protein MutS [Gammaproteobacteria bacterium]|nr:DNA mismatch repair protein MutS [Gammaproteobacteria bacterium]
MTCILEIDAKTPPTRDAFKSLTCGTGLIDEATANTIEIEALYDAVNHCQTRAGEIALWRRLLQPYRSHDDITQVQQAMSELDNKNQLSQSITKMLEDVADTESDLYDLLYGTFLGMFGSYNIEQEFEGYGYEQYRRGTRCIVEFVNTMHSIPSPESAYLKALIEDVKGFSQSRIYALMNGPAYITESGVKTRDEKKRWIPALKFRPTLFKPFFLLFLIGIGSVFYFFPILQWMGIPTVVSKLAFFVAAPLLLAYIPVVGTFDRDSCIYPLRQVFRQSEELQNLIEVIGKLDILLSMKSYADQIKGPMTQPEFHASEQLSLRLEQAKNPILVVSNASYVGNHLDLTETRLLFITGPNSGGKTAFCKTVAQIQILAQIGCKVPAEQALLSVVDHIFYQAPSFGSLSDGEGRFGAELKRTKEIFIHSTQHSLVILDELSEGTTNEERMETSVNILDGFKRKHNATLLITHNHQLVDYFIDQDIGQAWQVEFVEDGTALSGPTYRLIPGISRLSHAQRIASKIGFSKQDIEKHLSRTSS